MTSTPESALPAAPRLICASILFALKWAFLLIVAAFVLNLSALHKEEEALRPLDDLYDIGFDQQLYLKCEGTGTPTVLFDAPTGYSSDIWAKVSSALSDSTRVCVYDRSGIGFSDAPRALNMSDPAEAAVAKVRAEDHTALRMANDLAALLMKAGGKVAPAPFVIVGAEVGAATALAFSRIHPELVHQVVMLDPVSSVLFEDERWANDFHLGGRLAQLTVMLVAAGLGLSRVAMLASEGFRPELARTEVGMGEDTIARQMHFHAKLTHLYTAFSEHLRLNESCAQLERIFSSPPPSNPSLAAEVRTAVITGNYYDETAESYVNRAWSQSARHVIKNAPVLVDISNENSAQQPCRHSVFNGADRRHVYKNPDELTRYIEGIVRRFRKRKDI